MTRYMDARQRTPFQIQEMHIHAPNSLATFGQTA